jgi:hypothetical protein
VTQAAVEPGKACPIELAESEVCATDNCTAAGLACSEYTTCTDCTDNGKTSPRRCQFCAQPGGVGVCQSLFVDDRNASSGLRACPIDFDARATTIAACSPDGAAQTTSTVTAADTAADTTVAQVIETVDIVRVLNLGVNETTPLASVTLGDGIRLQVRVVGEDGAMLRALGSGIGVFSPSRDGPTAATSAAAYSLVRAGVSVEFLFAKDRPVSFRRLTLGAWDDGDTAQVVLSNDDHAAQRRRDETTNVIVLVNEAEWTFDSKDTAAGFTKYSLSAVGESEFTIKSFEFAAARAAIDTPRGAGDVQAMMSELEPSGFQFDTMTIALIAAGGAVCLLLLIVLIVCAARRRRNGKSSDESRSDSTSMDEMRPALGGAEFTLATTELARARSDDHLYKSLPTPHQQQQPPHSEYRELQPQASQPYLDLHVSPSPSEAGGAYRAIPVNSGTQGVAQPHFGTQASLSQGSSTGEAGFYMPVPVAGRYDAVSGNENFVQAIEATGNNNNIYSGAGLR